MSAVDLNRSGVALMEIVSKPDLRSSDEAKAFSPSCARSCAISAPATATWRRAACAPTSTCRCASRAAPLGTRCEIKNVNSIRFVGQAIEYEARRQIEIIEDGGTIDQETRLFDPNKGETRSMRSQGRGARLPLLPRSRSAAARIRRGLCRGAEAASAGTAGREEGALHRRAWPVRLRRRRAGRARRALADYFEAVAKGRDAKAAANWVINELIGRLNKEGKDIADTPVSAAQLGAVLDLIGEGTISGKIAKDLFEIVWTEGGDPRAIVEQRGMKQVTDLGAIEKVVDEIVAKNPDKVARGQGQSEGDRLVRRSGDESLGRQGQSAGGERSAQEQARPLTAVHAGRCVSVAMRRKVCARALETSSRATCRRRCDARRCASARRCESLRTNSLVFDRIHRPRNASEGLHLWKKFSDLGKTDTASPFATLSASHRDVDFHRARETRIEFAICAKT